MDTANLLLRITGNNQDAKRSLREVAEEVRRFAQQEAEAHLKVGGEQIALAQIDRLDKALTLIGNRDVTAKVKVRIDQERADLGGLKKELEHSIAGGAGARDRDSILRDINRVGDSIGTLGKSAGVLSQVGEGFIGLTGSVIGLVGALPPLLVLLPLILFVLSAVLGVVLALVSALALAAAGAVALGVAFVALLGPALAVVIAGAIELAKVIKAATVSEEDLAAQQQAVDDAIEARADATAALAEAQQGVKDAAVDAYRAWEDAIEAVDDAIRGVTDAELGLEQAHLNVEKAKNRLDELREAANKAGPAFQNAFERMKDAGRDPAKLTAALRSVRGLPGETDAQTDLKQGLIDYAQAQQGVKNAEDRVSDAIRTRTRAQERANEFTKEGIKAYEPYKSALKGVEAAVERVADAEEAVAAAREKQAEATKGMSAASLGLVATMRQFIKDLKEAFGPAVEGFVLGVGRALEALGPMFLALEEPLGELGTSIGDMLATIAEELGSPRFIEAFSLLTEAASEFMEIAGPALTDLLYIILQIALAAMPYLLDAFEKFAGWLDEIASRAEKGGLAEGVGYVIEAFKELWGLARAVARIIINFLKGSGDESRRLVRQLTAAARRFAEFLDTEEGRESVKQWISDSISLMGDFLSVVREILPVLREIFKWINKAIEGYGLLSDLISGDDVLGQARRDEAANKLDERIANDPSETAARRRAARERIRERIESYATGGIFSNASLIEVGEEPGVREAVIPLKQSVLREIGAGIVNSLSGATPAVALAGGGAYAGRAGVHQTFTGDIVVKAPPGSNPDPRGTAVEFSRELARRGGGSLTS